MDQSPFLCRMVNPVLKLLVSAKPILAFNIPELVMTLPEAG